MATTAPYPATVHTNESAEPTPAPRWVLTGISWETYESIIKDHEDRSTPRFTFDQGTLEIMSPSTPHEEEGRILADAVLLVALELGVELRNVGSTTFRREDIEAGCEADVTFYIQNELKVRGKRQLDADVAPPPDLLIEVDASHSSLDKLALFGRFGIPEIWRVEDGAVLIDELQGDRHRQGVESLAIPPLSATTLTQFLALRRSTALTEWARAVRSWARDRRDKG